MKEGSQSTTKLHSNSQNAFAVDLYRQVSQQKGNLLLSPFSIRECLRMAYVGSCGPTKTQMADVLHLDTSLGALLGSERTRTLQEEGVQLSVANALWAQIGIKILPEFLALVHRECGGEFDEADFANAPEEARRVINNWVARKTGQMIPKILELLN